VEKEFDDELKGTDLDVYRFMLKAGKPLGIRELQRAMNFSSPSVAQYHLSKLERMGLIKKKSGNYIVNKILLPDFVKISHFLIPRYFFYSVFAALVLIIEITVLIPDINSPGFLLAIFSTSILLFIFCYETAKVWRRGWFVDFPFFCASFDPFLDKVLIRGYRVDRYFLNTVSFSNSF
jgi:DNA-binding transcriptional ArsR family regulator